MLISSKSSELLSASVSKNRETFCSGLFLSARWFVFSQVAKGASLIVLPNRDAAEYCASDLYNLIEGDRVFFLPTSGKNIEKSNYKSSLGVQRTSAIEKILSYGGGDLLCIVSYPEALSESIPVARTIQGSRFSLETGQEISHDSIRETLSEMNFEKVDFVALPGQYAVRGSIVDIFSYSFNHPFRISFFGNEIEKITLFDCNTQSSMETVSKAEICADLSVGEEAEHSTIFDILPSDTTLWLDSSDMYREQEFFVSCANFRKVYLEVPLSIRNTDEIESIRFGISPQPVFNKNFNLLSGDIREKMEQGYSVFVYGEKKSQLDRLSNILSQQEGLLPQFVQGKNIHSGFIDRDDKVCCYTDHEIFDRFHRVAIRRSVEKSEQLTINDLSAFNIGDYVVHIDHGVGIFGGLVRMHDDKDRVREVVKLMYKDGDCVFVSVHNLHKISKYKSKDSTPPTIHRLGSKTWSALKGRAKSRVKDIAKELIQLYAKRKASKGFAYSADTYLQEELESSFMYEDTPDQITATQAVKKG